MKAESKYDAEPITWWKCLQRATKYVQGESLIYMGPLKVIFQQFFTGGLTHTVVSSAHTVVVCVVRGGGGGLVNTGVLKLFSRSFLREIEPHSGSDCSHSGCLCCGSKLHFAPIETYTSLQQKTYTSLQLNPTLRSNKKYTSLQFKTTLRSNQNLHFAPIKIIHFAPIINIHFAPMERSLGLHWSEVQVYVKSHPLQTYISTLCRFSFILHLRLFSHQQQ